MKAKVPQTMSECFDLIEGEMLKGPWVMGEDYSIGDAYLFTVSRWLEGDGVDINQFPRVADHFQRMLKRPAVQKIIALYWPNVD